MKRILLLLLVCPCFFSCQEYSVDDYDELDSDGFQLIDSLNVNEYERDSSQVSVLVTLPNGLVLEKRDSLYYWDDMVFTDKGLKFLFVDNRTACRDDAQFYWKHGIVPYRFNINVPPTDRSVYVSALNHIMNKTSVVFRYKKASDSDYIEFYKSTSGNNSLVGMQTGAQTINIQSLDMSTIVHEVMHSLGFLHEHTRVDRDNYIIIDSLNVKPDKWHNFQKYTESGYSGMDLGPFDFNSIMLYDSMITDPNFVYNTSIPTMTDLNGGLFCQGDTLSINDVIGVSSIYGPPFHRMEHHRLQVVIDTVNGFSEQFVTNDSDSLVFYADKDCTIRQALTYPRRIKIKKVIRYNSGNDILFDTSYQYLTIPSGTSSYHIWTGYNYENYYCSNPSYIYITNNSVVNELVDDANFI